jgi:hypothetical protein
MLKYSVIAPGCVTTIKAPRAEMLNIAQSKVEALFGIAIFPVFSVTDLWPVRRSHMGFSWYIYRRQNATKKTKPYWLVPQNYYDKVSLHSKCRLHACHKPQSSAAIPMISPIGVGTQKKPNSASARQSLPPRLSISIIVLHTRANLARSFPTSCVRY